MNYTQNERIAQVGDNTLVVGIDIGSDKLANLIVVEMNSHSPFFLTLWGGVSREHARLARKSHGLASSSILLFCFHLLCFT